MKKHYSDFTLYEMSHAKISKFHRLPDIHESNCTEDTKTNVNVEDNDKNSD